MLSRVTGEKREAEWVERLCMKLVQVAWKLPVLQSIMKRKRHCWRADLLNHQQWNYPLSYSPSLERYEESGSHSEENYFNVVRCNGIGMV